MIKETFDYINEFEIKYIVNIWIWWISIMEANKLSFMNFKIQLIREANLKLYHWLQ